MKIRSESLLQVSREKLLQFVVSESRLVEIILFFIFCLYLEEKLKRENHEKIINPWKGLEGYNCFGCAPDNEVGVKMEFYEDGDEIVSIWKPRPEYQGWIDTLHGGIQAVFVG